MTALVLDAAGRRESMVCWTLCESLAFFFLQAEDGMRYYKVTGVQTCALPIFHVNHPDRRLIRHPPLAHGGGKISLRARGGRRIVKARHQLASQLELDVPRITPAGGLASQRRNLGERPEGQQLEVTPHELVRNRHHLAEHAVRILSDADVVP